jgi:hypothetical protein
MVFCHRAQRGFRELKIFNHGLALISTDLVAFLPEASKNIELSCRRETV